jgi:hypothetical protein
MAYREFRNVEDTRPLPTGFEKGFNPDIPTQAEVDAIKQKQAQDAYKRAIQDPTLSFEKANDLDREWIEPQKQNASKRFINDYLLYGAPTPETEAEVNRIHLNIEKGYTDLANSKAVQDSYKETPELRDGVNAAVVEYNTTHPSERISGVQFVEGIKQRLPQLYNLNIAANNFTKTLADQESKQSNSKENGGVLISTESLIRSKIKDGKVTPEVLTKFYEQNPLVQQAIDYRRQASDIERVNSLKHKIGVFREQNLNGSYSYLMKKYDSPEELADAVSKGAAYPSDANGNPIKGFESGFNVEERNNQVASNYIMGAAGLSTAQETKVKVDEDKAPKNSFIGKRTINPDINLERSTINSLADNNSAILNSLLQGQELPNATYNDRPFIASSINNKEGVQPVVIKNSNFELADNSGNITGDLNVNGFTPVFFDEDGNTVVVPSNYTEKEKVDFLASKKGLKQGLIMVGVVENTDKEKKQVAVKITNPTDPNFVTFTKRVFNKQKPSQMFNSIIRQDPDAILLKDAYNTKAFKGNSTKNSKPTTKQVF